VLQRPVEAATHNGRQQISTLNLTASVTEVAAQRLGTEFELENLPKLGEVAGENIRIIICSDIKKVFEKRRATRFTSYAISIART
jgi:hypothetical protein